MYAIRSYYADITAENGSLQNSVTSPHAPAIWTRTLDVKAAAGVGTETSRLDVQLIREAGQTDLIV